MGCSDKRLNFEEITWRGWPGCYRMSNQRCEVVIAPSSGGRVLWFSLDGKNIVYENPSQNGELLDDWIKNSFDPDGGRFDYGPERVTQALHAQSWMGEWKSEIIDNQILRLTLSSDSSLGLRSIREFRLHADSAILFIDQKAINITDRPITRLFWGRTLVKPGGTMLFPVNPRSRFDNKWGRFLWNPDRIDSPKEIDERLQIRSDTLRFHAVGITIKAGTDATNGWIGYLLGDLLFCKRFPVYPEKDYSGSDNMTGIFYSNGKFAEMEPCGPTSVIQPDSSIWFSERWEISRR